MPETQKPVYQRRKDEGVLSLRGVVDIFEAASLLAAFQRAFDDAKSETLSVDMAQVDRIDVAAIQILIALKAAVIGAGRKIALTNAPPTIAKTFAQLGLNDLVQ